MSQEGPFNRMFDAKKDILKPVYFKIDVIERYFKDPKYLIDYSDYRGSIALDDSYFDSDNLDDYEYIKDFGLAYSKISHFKRAIVIFADDLIKMPAKVQGYWFYYLIDKQKDYFPNEGFVKNLIYGEWVEDISIYQALLMELHFINKMCEAISITPMFREEYSYDGSSQNQRPIAYHNILMPTRENYYSFVNTLEKITTSNINIKTFLCSPSTIKKVDGTYIDESGTTRNKGSVMLLSEWLGLNIVGNPNIQSYIIEPLKRLVKLRQTPAHKLYKNEYDETIWNDQNELIRNICKAIRYIRLLLANHPLSKAIVIPEYLYDGKHIRIY